MRSIARVLTTLVFTGIAALTPGCLAAAVAAGAAAGITGAAYVNGDLEANLDASVMEVAEAASAALEELSLPEVSRSTSEIEGMIRSESPSGKAIAIRLEAAASGTDVSIRVGTFGDEDMSVRIFEAIRDNLPS